MEPETNPHWSLVEGACTGLGNQCAEKGRKMTCPAFKNCLAHVHMGLTWLCHMQMTGLTHAHKGLAKLYMDDVILTCIQGLS